MNKYPISKRRVSFSNTTSVHLFKKEKEKTISGISLKDSSIELSINDDISESVSSPESFTEEINSRSVNLCLATKQLLDFSPSFDYKSMDLEAKNSSSTKEYERKSSIIFPIDENTTKIFFSPSTLEELDNSFDADDKEKDTFLVPSIEDLVEADQC